MKASSLRKKALSVLMVLLTVIGCLSPAFSVLADDGVIGVYDIQIFYEDGTLVPTYQEDGESDYIVYLMEGVKQQFTYQFIDCSLPDNGSVKWTSDTPTVCDVTEDGIVRAFDSSKGAAVRLWLDNEVATIPLIGSTMKSLLEKVLFNEYIDLDTMDTDSIIAIVESAFGSDSVLGKYIDSYKGELVDSLRDYLAKVNTKIYCTMYDANGTQLAQDYISVCVTKSDAFYADFIPNGTHITNKQDLPTTVAKGSTLQLYACTTPTRLHMGVVYSVKSSSILSNGKVIATVNDSGLVTFKNTGTVTILVSPDTDGFIANLLKYINYIYEIGNTGTIDSGEVADVLINYIGLDINRTVLMGILDACFAISDIVGDTADPVQLTATAVKIIANIIYQFTTNDSITFTVVDGVPLTYFDIGGAASVQEGAQIQLSIENVQPEAAITSDITWTSSDPSIASVDPVTGTITGRDAGGSLGSFSSQTVEITATSAANNFSQTVTIEVTGKTGINYISDVEITSDLDSINIGGNQYLHSNVYPQRTAESELLYIYWGVVTGGSEEEGYEYSWASDPYQLTDEEGNLLYDESGEPLMADGTVTDGIGTVDKNGYYVADAGGSCMVACRAVTGYYLLTGAFYEISEVITTKAIENGQPVTGISLQATGTTSGGTLTTSDIEVNGKTYHYATVKKTVVDGYYLNGCTIQATIEPSNATNKNLIWHLDCDDYYFDNQDDSTGTVSVKMKSFVEVARTVNVWCTSADGEVMSEVLTVTVTRNYATSNTIDGGDISITNGTSVNATHTMKFNNSTFTGGAYACYGANWYSSDEEIFSVESVDTNGNAVLRGNDVGVATLTCVSADGALIDTRTVTVYPDKSTMKSILDLCEKTVIHKTADNASDYQTYMRKLDYCYYLYYDVDLPSQTTVDTYADELLYIFYKLGGYVILNDIRVADKDGNPVNGFVAVNVSSLNYKNTSYDLNYQLYPANCMYSNITWKSNSSSVTVDKNGVCKPASNSSCYATITVSAKDYMGNEYSDSVVISFAKTNATGVSITPSSITGGKAGETQKLTATVLPSSFLTSANIKDVIWSSSDEGVAKVDSSGKVEFVYGGDCVITATTVDGGFVAQCPVNVITNYDPLRELVNTYKSLSLSVVNYYPDTYETFMTALDKAQKMIDANASRQNEVRAMCAELEAAYNGLKKYNYIQQVEIYLDGDAASDYYQYDISIFKEGIFNSYKNATLDLNVRLYPNNASYSSVVWESSSDVIEVSESGVCTINANTSCYGKITCTVTDHFGNSWSDDVWVSFAMYPVNGITLSDTEITGSIGESAQLVPTLSPTGSPLTHIGSASITDVVWSSDDENIAAVDQKGLVTFTGAGATKIRVTTLDGGYTAECIASTEGNRAMLVELLEKYADYNYMDYKYNFGMNFKNAYEEAQRALEDNSYTQSQIDAAADALDLAGYALAGNEFSYAETISLNAKYESSNILGSWSNKSTAALSNDATAVSRAAYDSNYTQNTRITLTGSVYPSSPDYVSLTWNTISKSGDTSVSINGTSVTVNANASNALPSSKSAQATLMCIATDAYGRTVTRTINVVIAKKTVTGIALDQTNVTAYSDSSTFKLNASISPSDANIKDVIWSSSNESVATVDQDGNVTPIANGRCTITAETFDGGYRAQCEVNLVSNFSTLANLYAQYMQFVNDVKEEHIYTAASLAVLQEALANSKIMIEEATASQQEVNAMTERLQAAYDGLVKLVAVQKITVNIPEQQYVSEPNAGFVRYNATSISGASFYFNVSTYPSNSSYDKITYECDNPDITVTEYGIVTKNTGTSNQYGKITITTVDEAGNSCSASFYVVFVRIAATGISIDKDTVFGAPQEQVKLSPDIASSSNIANASITACIYESANPEIASVDENGMVTFNTQGETEITIRTVDGGYSTAVKAYTTWDSTALTAAVNQYASVDYMGYAYEYGMAFKDAYETAVEVRDNYASTQAEIDNALAALQTAYNDLSGHEFIYIGTPSLVIGGTTVENGANFAVDENNQVIVYAAYNEGAMVQSQSFTYENAAGVIAQQVGDALVITKTSSDTAGSIDVTFTAVDAYGREEAVTRTIRIVNAILPISDFKFTYNGEEVTKVDYKATVITNKTVQLGINIYPEDAEAYKSISWTSSNSTITVDDNGLVKMGTGSISTSSYSAIITCTVELNDGSTITHTITVTFTRGR